MPDPPAKPSDMQAIAVIGAGRMGRGIAHAAALGGYRTILEDLLPNALRRAESEIRKDLEKSAELGHISGAQAEAAFRRIQFAGSLEDAARAADFVIEAVPDEMESKVEIFTLLDKMCRPATILALNTSSLSLTEIAAVTYRRSRCVGMRFRDPVREMKDLEIVRSPATDEETLAIAVEVGKHMGKRILVIEEGTAAASAAQLIPRT